MKNKTKTQIKTKKITQSKGSRKNINQETKGRVFKPKANRENSENTFFHPEETNSRR